MVRFLALALLPGLAGCSRDPLGGGADAEIRWSFATAGGVAGPPYADAGVTLVAPVAAPGVLALDPETGEQLWRVPLDLTGAPASQLPPSRIARDGPLAVIPAWKLVALDPADGRILWEYAPDYDYPGTGNPVIAGSRVVAVGNHLHVLDAATGGVIWWQELGERPFSPVVSDGVIYVGAKGPIPGRGEFPNSPLGAGHVWAIELETGSVLWKTFLPADTSDPASGGISSHGALTSSLFIVAGSDSRMHALSRATGEVVWSSPIPGQNINSGIVVVRGVAVTTGLQGGASGYDVDTGIHRWTFPINSSVLVPLSRDGDDVLVTVGRIFALDGTDGGERWGDGGAAWGGPIYLRGTAPAGDGIVVAATDQAVVGLEVPR